MSHPEQSKFPVLHYLNIPVVVSLLGIYASLAAVYWFAYQQITEGMVLILAAIACDQVDGLLARKINKATVFGSYLDVLADFLAYCLFPVAAMFALLAGSSTLLVFSGVFLLAGSLRLAYCLTTGNGNDRVIIIPACLLIMLLPYNIQHFPGNLLLVLLMVFITASSVLFFSSCRLQRGSVPVRILMLGLLLTGFIQLANL